MPRKLMPKKVIPEPRCEISIRASVKNADVGGWRELKHDEPVAAGDEVEILVLTTCKAFIDVKPDNSTPIAAIKWASITFAPARNVCSRVKIAYYRASKIRRSTDVTFFATARCAQCGDCAGMEMQELVLTFDVR
jgi:hypothetical protein